MLLKNNKIIILSMILDIVLSVFNIYTYFTILTCLLYDDSYVYLVLLIYGLVFKGSILILIPLYLSVLITKYIMQKTNTNLITVSLFSIFEVGFYLLFLSFETFNIFSLIFSIFSFIAYTFFYQKTHNNFQF